MTKSEFLSIALSLSFIALPFSGSANSKSSEGAVRKAIFALDRAWSRSVATHDLKKILNYYSSDAVMLPPNAPLAKSAKEIHDNWVPLAADGAVVTWAGSKVVVSKSCDMAYIYGSYKLSLQEPGGKSVKDHGKFLEVWQKQVNGSWKCSADMFNTDLPTP